MSHHHHGDETPLAIDDGHIRPAPPAASEPMVANPRVAAIVHDALVQCHIQITEKLRRRRGCSERDASDIAADCIRVLQELYGGWRLGPRGVYIPAPGRNQSFERDEAIRAGAGPAPHSRALVKRIAEQHDCSIRSVRRALSCLRR